MLMRTDPFRELDRITQQVFGTAARPTAMPMDAWRSGDEFVVEFDLPGVDPAGVELDVERNVLTVRAQRPVAEGPHEMVAAERPRGVFSRQLILGDNLDAERISANYHAGVLTLRVPVAERAKPRRITVETSEQPQAIGS
ncbi:Hsp20 family protein [Kineococcus sp. T13]|uniref:Hsp20/alpha crystallin family protein n=1 Tax=Kineococcus vitellinus TaxID=2696565 RepID=UPI0014123D21|nr:Hsp20 family protein [Kineococcus vitellinus]NAZ76441.1 Hsp20 family protein [Kineococcus vitellinus]